MGKKTHPSKKASSKKKPSSAAKAAAAGVAAVSAASNSNNNTMTAEQQGNIEKLIEQGNIALSKPNIGLAERFFKRALEMSPTDTSIMDALADAHLQRGAFVEALALLENSCTLAPHENPFKWLFLGQLQNGLQAVQSYRTAIEEVGKQLEQSDDKEVEAVQEVITKQIAKAYCSIAELYLTDLCFEENAEQACEEAVSNCLQTDPDSLDGKQTMANLYISQNRKKEAVDLIRTVYDKIVDIRGKVLERTVITDFTQEDESEELMENPEMEFCLTTIKIMIECTTEDASLVDKAMDLMADLLNEDDEVIELWYMVGVAESSKEQPDQELVRYHFETALRMMDSLRNQTIHVVGDDFAYQAQYDSITSHFNELHEQGSAGAEGEGEGEGDRMEEAQPNNEDEGKIAIDEEWSDEEESDRM